jgi:DNA-binding response OmpR family regulator
VLSSSLASSGFSTRAAGTVDEGLEVLDEVAVDALVVDLGLPATSGLALVEEVRSRDRRLPIIMISGSASEDDKTAAKRAGADRFFDKSDLRSGALVAALRDLLDR